MSVVADVFIQGQRGESAVATISGPPGNAGPKGVAGERGGPGFSGARMSYSQASILCKAKTVIVGGLPGLRGLPGNPGKGR